MIKTFENLVKELQSSENIIFDGMVIKSKSVMDWKVSECIREFQAGKFSQFSLCVGQRDQNCKGYDICKHHFCDDTVILKEQLN